MIDEIYEFIEQCKLQPLSQTKIIVPKEEIYRLLDDLRLCLPDEIRRYQKIVSNRDSLISDAEKMAEQIRSQAKEQARILIGEHEVYRQAYGQANEMLRQADDYANALLKEAKEESAQIRAGALEYANGVLAKMEGVLADAYESNLAKNEGMVNNLKQELDALVANRSEVSEQIAPPEPSEPAYQSDSFEIDENDY